MGGITADKRDMSASDNFKYDADGNMTNDNSKDMSIAYDWRGMPVEFKRFRCTTKGSTVCDSVKLVMAYDGSGRRISKTRYAKDKQFGYWYLDHVTHYTGIGTEVREAMRRSASPETKVVVNLPQGLGRYMPEDAVDGLNGVSGSQLAGYRPPAKFEWYLKNHLGSTMLVYGTSAYSDPLNSGYKGGVQAAYDYRAFGEQVDLTEPTDKVTENFTGKEKDDETELNYFGARYLDPMLGLWISVDPKRQFSSPYLYAGNGVNPIGAIDPDGNEAYQYIFYVHNMEANTAKRAVNSALAFNAKYPNADYAIKYAENQQQLIQIINNGKTSVMLTHGLETYDGDGMKNMFGASDDVNLDMTYQELNANLHPGSSVKIFSCFSNLSDDFSNVTPARQSLLGVPFIADYNTEVDGGNGAADAEMYLELQYERDNGYYYEAY